MKESPPVAGPPSDPTTTSTQLERTWRLVARGWRTRESALRSATSLPSLTTAWALTTTWALTVGGALAVTRTPAITCALTAARAFAVSTALTAVGSLAGALTAVRSLATAPALVCTGFRDSPFTRCLSQNQRRPRRDRKSQGAGRNESACEKQVPVGVLTTADRGWRCVIVFRHACSPLRKVVVLAGGAGQRRTSIRPERRAEPPKTPRRGWSDEHATAMPLVARKL